MDQYGWGVVIMVALVAGAIAVDLYQRFCC